MLKNKTNTDNNKKKSMYNYTDKVKIIDNNKNATKMILVPMSYLLPHTSNFNRASVCFD